MGVTPPDPLRFADPAVVVTSALDGLEIRAGQPLSAYPRHLGELLAAAARDHPDRCFLAERGSAGGAWHCATYSQVHGRVPAIAAGLLGLGLGPQRPLLLLAENGIDHALLMFAAMHVGVPVVPVSTAYSTMSRDFARLRSIVARVRPGAVFVDRLDRHRLALAGIEFGDAHVIVGDGEGVGIAGLEGGVVGPLVDEATAGVGPDTVAKILFTSGSTGEPKGVINTQRMMCSNQAATALLLPFLADDARAGAPPLLCDWLPWNHTFGANSNLNLVLFHGGTLYIDGGKPTAAGLATTIANLREVAPTLYFNVPRGFDMLVGPLESDAELRRIFFSRLRLLFYAGAALSQSTWTRLQALAHAERGRPIPIITGWGSTETAPAATMLHWQVDEVGNIGLPLPGTTVKLVPRGQAFELCVRGPNVTPGYLADPEATREAFDAAGYYRTGDAGRLADPTHPERGLVYEGRLAEDFKLSSGTWVTVSRLRLLARAALAPWIRDCVLAGHDREELGLLLFLDEEACRGECGPDFAAASASELAANPRIRELIGGRLAAHNREHRGSASRFARALVLAQPPSIDAGEITDKGYVNQRAVLDRRAADVARLFDDEERELLRPATA